MPSREYGFYLSAIEKADAQPVITPGGSGYFSSPRNDLDPKLFNGQTFRPEVRQWILHTLYSYWSRKYALPEEWSTVWVAGSGISYQWASDRSNGDLDVLIGVHFPEFFSANEQYRGLNEEEMADIFNQEFHTELWPKTDRTHIGVNSYPWVEYGSQTSKYSATDTSRGTLSTQSVGTQGSAPTLLRPTSTSKASNSVKDSAGPPTGSVPAGSQSLSPGNAGLANGSTSETGILQRSTASALLNSTEFWKTRMDDVPSVAPTNQRDASTSIIATPPVRSGVSSVSGVITESDSSGIASKGLNDSSPTSSETDGVFSVTYYVNPHSADIRDINPYAAYNVTTNEWTVKPPVLPSDPSTLYPQEYKKAVGEEQTQATALVARHASLKAQAEAMNPGTPGWVNATSGLSLVVQQARALFDSIHLGRKQAFGPGGSGYGDYYNYRWQAHKQAGTVQALAALSQIDKDAHLAQSTDLYGRAVKTATKALTEASLWNRGVRR